jgi:Tol biopolymer transport system component
MEEAVFTREIAWSPDGSELLLGTYDEYRKFDVAIVDRDGSNFQMLTNNPEQDYFSPIWSPDSSHFAFIISEYGVPRRLLAFDRVSQTMLQLAEEVRYNSPLAWSSDERYLFFAISHVPVDGRADEIWMADVASSSLQQLTFEGGSSPVWWP